MEVDQQAIERVRTLADKMAIAVGEVNAAELVMAGLEIAIRAMRASGMGEREAVDRIEQWARAVKGYI